VPEEETSSNRIDGILSTVYAHGIVKQKDPNMPVQKPIALARTTVTAAATEHLRQQIVRGSLQPGETLPESQVGEMLGVSRAPVREALMLLEREGLVGFDRRGTARVCEFDLAAVRELGLMRMVLEPVATRLAAQRRPKAGLDAIEENLHALKAVRRLDDVTRLDLDFHRLIFAAAGNKRLRRAWESLLAQFSLVMRRFHESLEKRARTSRVREMTIRAHTELLQAIRSGLPEKVEALARQHTTYWLAEFSQSKAFAPQSEE
jgi:DNA-binding GntR family transcriptional regulator